MLLGSSSSAVLAPNASIATGLGFGSSAGKCSNPGACVDTEMKRFAKMGIPVIPSRYLTPILKFDLHETDQGYQLFDTVIGSQ